MVVMAVMVGCTAPTLAAFREGNECVSDGDDDGDDGVQHSLLQLFEKEF